MPHTAIDGYRKAQKWSQLGFSALALAAGAAALTLTAAHAGTMVSSHFVAVGAAIEAAGVWIVLQLHAHFVARPLAERIERVTHDVASRDALTGLPTRHGFEDRLERALARYHRSGRRFALAYIDVDNFKRINDELGHPEGDRQLCEVAERLRRVVRSEDDVARIGGDEFAIILEGVTGFDDASILAERLHRDIARPRGAQAIPVSIGIALASFTHRATGALVEDADRALYTTKRRGRDGWSIARDAAPARAAR